MVWRHHDLWEVNDGMQRCGVPSLVVPQQHKCFWNSTKHSSLAHARHFLHVTSIPCSEQQTRGLSSSKMQIQCSLNLHHLMCPNSPKWVVTGLLWISRNTRSLKCHYGRFHGVTEGEIKHEGTSGETSPYVGCDRAVLRVTAWGCRGALCQVRLPGCLSWSSLPLRDACSWIHIGLIFQVFVITLNMAWKEIKY